MDVGSAKTAICKAMDALPEHVEAIGAHPMCGKEKSGPEAADAAIYHRRRFVLCPTRRTTPHAMHLAQQIVSAVRSQLVVMQPEEHDSAVAAISHLPYLVSAALVSTVKTVVDTDADDSQSPWQLAATGFYDTSRLAGSEVTMMADTLETNRDAVLRMIGVYQDSLDRLRHLLEGQDSAALRDVLEHIRAARQDWLGQHWNKTVD
jgi:prephenate dehydrogenase